MNAFSVRGEKALELLLPWIDPRSVEPSDFAGSQQAPRIDLNRGFRTYLLSAAFRTETAAALRRSLAKLETRPRLRDRDLWALYRATHLSASLKALGNKRSGKGLQERYFHYLASSEAWYFSASGAYPSPRSAAPELAASDALGFIGDAFDAYVTSSTWFANFDAIARAVLPITNVGQLAFAARLQRLLKASAPGVATELVYDASVDPRVRRAFAKSLGARLAAPAAIAVEGELVTLSRRGIEAAAEHFERSPDDLLRVRWCPRGDLPLEALGKRLVRYLTALHAYRVPVILEVAPSIDAPVPDALPFLFAVLDTCLAAQHLFARFDVDVKSREEGPSIASARADEQLSQMLYVQLAAELGDSKGDRIVLRRPVTRDVRADTRLEALPVHIAQSHFDLPALSELFEPLADVRLARFALGMPLAKTPPFRAGKKAERYLVFSNCSQIIPVSEDDASYRDAISFFEKPRPLQNFVEHYVPEEHDRVIGFVDQLVHNDILGVR